MRPSAFVAAAAAALTLASAAPAVAASVPHVAAPHAAAGTAAATTPVRATGASTSEPTPVPSGMQRVDLALAPRDASGLSALARDAHALSPTTRETRRQAALPGAARATEVATRAERLGLTLISTSDTDVTVAGTPDLVRQLFGSARATRPQIPTAQSLPDLPPSLRGLVLVAGGGDETRPSYRPRTTLSQAQLQGIYGVPSASTPPTASSPTVATLQFSQWAPSDLTAYVRSQHIYGTSSYDPVTGGGYSSVVVDGGPSDDSGSIEVALDQEALVTMAPGVRQRVYFANETDSNAEADAINQVAADAKSQHIVALSTSWGNCEPDMYGGPKDQQLQADELAIQNVIAAGVTVFAASGDSGSDDCYSQANAGKTTVDVPAAFPEVVAVGGTTVTTGSGGTTQTAWNGTGGGYSSLFTRPSYQDGVVKNGQRGVPDIAMVGDPGTGLSVYASGPYGCPANHNPCGVGGTSLSAPLAAASLASILADRGATSGLGDIHSLLYAAPSSAYTDITSGSNGAYAAGPGWDPTTGLGAPLWTSLFSVAAGSTPYVAITPTRVVDTRTGVGFVHTGPLTRGFPYTFRLPGSALPTRQQAYALNVTAIAPTGDGNLRLTPACGPTGTSSLVNYQPGQSAANFVIVANPAGCDAFTLESAGSPANVALDAVGYYTAGFTSVTPNRIADTRSGLGGTTGPIAAGSAASFTVPNVPAGTKAVAINVTAIRPVSSGNLRIYPDSGGDPPNVSNVNYIPGVDKAVFAVVQLPPDGKIDIYSAGSAANVAIDVFGYYPSTSTLVTASPSRVLDTRTASPLAAGMPYPVHVTGGSIGVPDDAQAVLVSLTAIHTAASTGVGNLAIYPAGAAPTVSTINYVGKPSDVANFAIVKVGSGGTVDLISNGSPIDAALDIVGYVPAGG